MFWLRNKKIKFSLRALNQSPETYIGIAVHLLEDVDIFGIYLLSNSEFQSASNGMSFLRTLSDGSFHS